MASYNPSELNAASTPPVVPPKPGSHEPSRISTPSAAGGGARPLSTVADSGEYYRRGTPSMMMPPPPPPPPTGGADGALAHGAAGGAYDTSATPGGMASAGGGGGDAAPVPDPGDQWLPQLLQDKSKQDIAAILADPTLLHALTHAPQTIHPSLQASHSSLHSALSDNVALANRLSEMESRLAHLRAATQAGLLSTHALERQWRQKQADTDHALAPFMPASLYMRLGQGVQEQAAVCHALEESFLDGGGGLGSTDAGGEGAGGGGGGGQVSERELTDWIRRYRDARTLHYLREERKERWDEGRVGGWR